MLVNGLGDMSYGIDTQKDKTISPKGQFESEKERSDTGKVLGIGFLDANSGNISYGMSAKYDEDSTPENPVIKVTIQKGGSEEVHLIHVNDVNVKGASEIEMFALCNYADDTGRGTGGKFGTWQTLNYYRTNAVDNGEFEYTKSMEVCLSLKQNWLSMIEQMRTLYFESGSYKQALDGDSLLKCLSDLQTEQSPVHDIYESMKQGAINQPVTTVGIYNMGYHTSLYLSDAGKLTCLDEKMRGKVLWEIPVSEEDYPKIEELMAKGLDFILREKDVAEQYLKGTIHSDDIQKLRDRKGSRSSWDDFLENCSEDVKKAWENIQGTDEMNRMNNSADEKVYFLTEIDKYMLRHLLDNVKTDGSLESTIRIMEDITVSLKASMEQYSSEMQEKKRMELDVYEKFKEELERLKQV